MIMMREMQFKLFFTHRVADIFNDNIDIHIILSNDDVYVAKQFRSHWMMDILKMPAQK